MGASTRWSPGLCGACVKRGWRCSFAPRRPPWPSPTCSSSQRPAPGRTARPSSPTPRAAAPPPPPAPTPHPSRGTWSTMTCPSTLAPTLSALHRAPSALATCRCCSPTRGSARAARRARCTGTRTTTCSARPAAPKGWSSSPPTTRRGWATARVGGGTSTSPGAGRWKPPARWLTRQAPGHRVSTVRMRPGLGVQRRSLP
mmetsp:Transcript_13646/g.41285  ORF Transcript_13646/g.41285 Transcript_13646/m.41285 type:complete len:200 (-) Transcript_13646:195-794(-)